MSFSFAKAASGIPVMPTILQPSFANLRISEAVSNLGPCVTPYVPEVITFIDFLDAALMIFFEARHYKDV